MQILELTPQQFPTYNTLIKLFDELKYTRMPMVMEPGEFAVRGSVIDIFPSNHTFPVRIEYDGDELDRMGSFDPQTQLSLSPLENTVIKTYRKTKKKKAIVAQSPVHHVLSEFKPGDYVVHESYGIGIFRGMVRRTFKHHEGEYLLLEYLDEDKIYVPLDQIQVLYPYADTEKKPQLTRLHDGLWERTKEKAIKATQKLAEDIYILQQMRQQQPGFACAEDSEYQIMFEKNFPYPLTPDQAKAIEDVKKDMMSTKPMDRLVCGDVGYGKTEVILRAAFKAIDNGKQVAILVPTTLLAHQHFNVFTKRFAPFPFNVAVMSRFISKSEQKEILEGIKKQTIDLVIGTHRLLQKDIQFKDLGLLVIDEEQRFGVAQKEKIKQYKLLVDVLSVSATPIPRTMYMSLSGAKEMTNILTPPQNRKPIKTYMEPLSDMIIKTAITDEVKRKGQVFYLFNNTYQIDLKKTYLQNLLPNVRIDVGHGKLSEQELQAVMERFLTHESDVLLCTTIVENGLDIPNANTIIIDGVENYGLSQVHQLKGRVGRSEKQAYAYLLFHANNTLSDSAQKRLKALKEYVVLGSGYDLALKDLEIRGAGNVLGKEQHGHMISVGFTLYCKLLEEAVAKTHGEAVPDVKLLGIGLEELTVFVPYISSERERLAVYQRILLLKSEDDLNQLMGDLADRYGKPSSDIIEVYKHIFELLRIGAFV